MNTSHQFQEIINDTKPVLVDFMAEWCGPCKTMKPILEQLKQKFGDKIRILKVDVDKNQNIAAQLHISGVPTLILYRHGKQIWRQTGVVPTHQLEQIIQTHIQ